MKTTLFLFSLCLFRTGFSQSLAGQTRQVNFAGLREQLVSERNNLKNLGSIFKSKYPNGIDSDRFVSFVLKIDSAEKHFRPTGFNGDLFQSTIDPEMDIFLPRGFKYILNRITASGLRSRYAEDTLNYLWQKQDRQEMEQLIVRRLSFNGIQSVDLTIDSLKSDSLGTAIGRAFDPSIFTSAKQDYLQHATPITPINKNDFLHVVKNQLQQAKIQKDSFSITIAAVAKAKQNNYNAVSQIKTRVDNNNAAIKKLESSSQGSLSDSAKTAIADLSYQNTLNIEAIQVGSAEDDEDIIHEGNQVIIINDDIDESPAIVSPADLQEQWDDLPLESQIKTLQTSNQFDGYFKDSSDKDSAVQQYNAINYNQSFNKSLNDFNAYGQVALGVMEQYNIGSPQLQEGIKYGLEATSVASAYFQGGVPAALTQAALFFLKSGPNVEVQLLQSIQVQINRLEADMDAQFGAVHLQLDSFQMNVNQDFTIISAQLDSIAQRVVQMENDNYRNFEFINNKLNAIIKQIDCLQKSMQDLALYKSCENFYDIAIQSPIKSLRDVYANYPNFTGCVGDLYSQIGRNIPANDIFNNSGCDDSFAVNDLYKNAIKMLKRSFKRTNNFNNSDTLSFLMYPISNLRIADSFFSYVTGNKTYLSAPGHKNPIFCYSNIFNVNNSDYVYKNASSVLSFDKYFLFFLPYLERYNGSHKLIDSLTPIGNLRLKIIDNALDQMLSLTEFSLAQNLLLSGNYLVMQVGDIIKNGSDKELRTLFSLLKDNPLFDDNLGRYLISNAFKDSAQLNRYISMGQQHKNCYFSLPGDRFNWLNLYSGAEGELYFDIQTLKPVSTTDTASTMKKVLNTLIPVAVQSYRVGDTKFILDTESRNLIDMRNKLVQTMVDYNIFTTIPVSDRKVIDQTDLLYLLITR